MTITSIIVMFAIIWFLVLFLCLQINIQTQGDVGERIAGTHSSSPVNFNMAKRVKIATLITIPIWALSIGVILSGVVTVEMMDIFSPKDG